MNEAHLLVFEVALAVRVVERGGDLRGDEQRELRLHRLSALLAAAEDGFQIVAIDVLHGDVVGVLDLAEVVDVDDVVVVELRGQLGLIDEHLDEVLVVRQMGKDLLDGDRLLESFDAAHPRLPDLGHAARGDLLDHHVLAELHAVRDFLFLDARCFRRCEDGLRHRHAVGDVSLHPLGVELRRRCGRGRRLGRSDRRGRTRSRRSGRGVLARRFLETGKRVVQTLVEIRRAGAGHRARLRLRTRLRLCWCCRRCRCSRGRR